MTLKPNLALQFVFICPLSSGLHARPASHFAEVANQFAAECTLTNLRNGLVGNGKSVLGIIATDIRHSDPCSLFLEWTRCTGRAHLPAPLCGRHSCKV